jgi:serine/threonine protein kinase
MLSKVEENQHVVKFIELLKTQNNYYFVYEFCNEGTLEKLMLDKKIISEKESLKIFFELLQAFRTLIKYHIMHRDLKPTNILIHDGTIKLADFGFCRPLKNKDEMVNINKIKIYKKKNFFFFFYLQ